MNILSLNLPITDPTWIFFIVLIIILFSPMILEKLRIPHIIGMIFAGIIIGEHGFNILERDSSFELFGKVGLYYIMFLAGLEMDLDDFKKNSTKGIVFGLLTFVIPMLLGIWSSMELLGFGVTTSVLLASMYASHTLIAYPIISRYGLSKLKSVNITVGGTAITVALALVVLAVISGMYKGDAGNFFWLVLTGKVVVATLAIVYTFPIIARWFFKKYSDSIMQFVFVLAMVFLGAGLMELAGMEAVLGAFLAGLVLNRLVPHVSPLMNRLEFVGNALFIPYFLIGVGMIIDVNALLQGGTALKVAIVMTVVATLSKWLAAFATQKIYRMKPNERSMMFGLSNAQAAATLAAVLIGHEIIMENGERLLNDDVLNGTVVMILFTCIISSLATERSAHKFATEEDMQPDRKDEEDQRIMLPIANPETIENLVNLALMVRDKKYGNPIYALSVINDSSEAENGQLIGERNLERAAGIAASADVPVKMISRFDVNIASGIIHTVKEQNITNVIIGLHYKAGIIDSFFGNLTESLLKGTLREVAIARLKTPVNTIKKMHILVPPKAEYATGFRKWIKHLAAIASQAACRMLFTGDEKSLEHVRKAIDEFGMSALASYRNASARDWNDFEPLGKEVQRNDMLVLVSARRGSISYDPSFERFPVQLSKYFAESNLIVIYPEQFATDKDFTSFSDPLGHTESQDYYKARKWLSSLIKSREEEK